MDPITEQLAKSRKEHEPRHDRECLECKQHYKAKFTSSKFCSDNCRNTYNRKAKTRQLSGIDQLQQLKPTKPEKEIPPVPAPPVHVNSLLNGAQPHIQIGIDLLRKDSQRWEDAYKEERTKRKDLQTKLETTRDELAKLKVDHQIEAIENKKPSGLSGLAENPMVMKLVDHVGPALGAWIMKMTDAPGTAQLVGTDGQLDEAVATQINDINVFFAALPKPTQDVLYGIIHTLGQSKTTEILNDTLMRIQNFLKNGSTIIPHYGYGNI